MNEFLYGLIGGMLGSSRATISTPTYEQKHDDGLASAQRKANQLKEEELELKKKEKKKNEVKEYLESIPLDIERECLEVDIYDTQYQLECREELYNLSLKEPEGRWLQEKQASVYNKLFRSTIQKEQDICRAYEKFYVHKDIEFGPIIGRSEDRYDYVMRLKIGPSYTPKYISKTTLNEILKSNKYGMSEGVIV